MLWIDELIAFKHIKHIRCINVYLVKCIKFSPFFLLVKSQTNKFLFQNMKKKCSPKICFLQGKSMLNVCAVLKNHLHSVSLHADQSRWTVVFIFLIICLFPSLFVSQRKAMSVIRHHYDPLTCIYLRLPPFLCSHPPCCLCLRIGWIFKRGIVF